MTKPFVVLLIASAVVSTTLHVLAMDLYAVKTCELQRSTDTCHRIFNR